MFNPLYLDNQSWNLTNCEWTFGWPSFPSQNVVNLHTQPSSWWAISGFTGLRRVREFVHYYKKALFMFHSFQHKSVLHCIVLRRKDRLNWWQWSEAVFALCIADYLPCGWYRGISGASRPTCCTSGQFPHHSDWIRCSEQGLLIGNLRLVSFRNCRTFYHGNTSTFVVGLRTFIKVKKMLQSVDNWCSFTCTENRV